MSDIFISYASQDRDRVKVLAETLATQFVNVPFAIDNRFAASASD